MPRQRRGGGVSLTADELATHERARAALAEGKRLLPGWRAAARMLSRNNSLNVNLGAGQTSCTNGKDIFIRVPAELADLPEHDRGLCGERDEHNVLLCAACDVLEDVNITIIHEILHIIFDTFEDVSPYERTKLVEQAIRLNADGEANFLRAARIRQKIEKLSPEQSRDYLNLSNAVSPFLPLIINAGEDIRVNAMMQKERPGTRVMFDAQTRKIFRDGIMDYDGCRRKWVEAPPNAQALIGVYCKVGNLNFRDAIREDIADALDDPELDALCEQMRQAKSVRIVYRLSIPLPGDTSSVGVHAR